MALEPDVSTFPRRQTTRVRTSTPRNNTNHHVTVNMSDEQCLDNYGINSNNNCSNSPIKETIDKLPKDISSQPEKNSRRTLFREASLPSLQAVYPDFGDKVTGIVDLVKARSKASRTESFQDTCRLFKKLPNSRRLPQSNTPASTSGRLRSILAKTAELDRFLNSSARYPEDSPSPLPPSVSPKHPTDPEGASNSSSPIIYCTLPRDRGSCNSSSRCGRDIHKSSAQKLSKSKKFSSHSDLYSPAPIPADEVRTTADGAEEHTLNTSLGLSSIRASSWSLDAATVALYEEECLSDASGCSSLPRKVQRRQEMQTRFQRLMEKTNQMKHTDHILKQRYDHIRLQRQLLNTPQKATTPNDKTWMSPRLKALGEDCDRLDTANSRTPKLLKNQRQIEGASVQRRSSAKVSRKLSLSAQILGNTIEETRAMAKTRTADCDPAQIIYDDIDTPSTKVYTRRHSAVEDPFYVNHPNVSVNWCPADMASCYTTDSDDNGLNDIPAMPLNTFAQRMDASISSPASPSVPQYDNILDMIVPAPPAFRVHGSETKNSGVCRGGWRQGASPLCCDSSSTRASGKKLSVSTRRSLRRSKNRKSWKQRQGAKMVNSSNKYCSSSNEPLSTDTEHSDSVCGTSRTRSEYANETAFYSMPRAGSMKKKTLSSSRRKSSTKGNKTRVRRSLNLKTDAVSFQHNLSQGRRSHIDFYDSGNKPDILVALPTGSHRLNLSNTQTPIKTYHIGADILRYPSSEKDAVKRSRFQSCIPFHKKGYDSSSGISSCSSSKYHGKKQKRDRITSVTSQDSETMTTTKKSPSKVAKFFSQLGRRLSKAIGSPKKGQKLYAGDLRSSPKHADIIRVPQKTVVSEVKVKQEHPDGQASVTFIRGGSMCTAF